MRRVLVCGGRDFRAYEALRDVMDGLGLGPDSVVIHGDAPGADRLADRWAKERNIPRAIFPANWDGEGRSAGPKRNARMLGMTRPDLVVAFPGGAGTADMMRRARNAGCEVMEVWP